jgi:hypothetical protein
MLIRVCHSLNINSGQALVTDPNERWSCAKLNCYLAHRTRDSTAFEAALTLALYAMIFAGPPFLIPMTPPAPATPESSPLSAMSTSSINVTVNSPSPSGTEHKAPDMSPDSKSSSSTTGSSVGHLSIGNAISPSIDEDGENNDDIMTRPSSMIDYDSTIDPAMWTDNRRQVLLRIYWLRLALEYACNRVTEGDSFAIIALARSPSGIDRARLLCLCSKSAGYRTNYSVAIEYGIQALVAMNVFIPPRSAWERRARENQDTILHQVKERNGQFVSHLPAVSSPEELLTVKVSQPISLYHPYICMVFLQSFFGNSYIDPCRTCDLCVVG